MTMQIRLFGREAELAGRRTLRLDLPSDSATCVDVRRAILKAEPALAPVISACRIAVNCEFARDNDRVAPADELALIGTVSGG